MSTLKEYRAQVFSLNALKCTTLRDLAVAIDSAIAKTEGARERQGQGRLDRLARAENYGITRAEQDRLDDFREEVSALLELQYDEILVQAVLKELDPAEAMHHDIPSLRRLVDDRTERFRDEVVAAIEATRVGGEPPNVPNRYLEEWTDGFNATRKLGEGGFGEVFEGIYNDKKGTNMGRIAVKRFAANVELDRSVPFDMNCLHYSCG